MALGKGKNKIEDAQVVEPKGNVSAKDKAAATAKAAKEKAEAAKAKKDEAAAAKEAEKAEKEAKKKEEAEAKEAKKLEDAEKRESMKGLSKLLRSFLARIKYMVYMDNPAAGIEGIENLNWSLSFVNSVGSTITVTRGETTNEIAWTMVTAKKQKTNGVCAADAESLETLFASWEA